MTRIKIGVDNGNYNTKSSERMLYASGFAVSDREFITSDMQLFYESTYYAIGGKRMSFQQDKTKENDAFILTLPAIANSMRLGGVSTAEILLGVGLPIDIYGTPEKGVSNNTSSGGIFTFASRMRSTFAESWIAEYSHKDTLRYAGIINS